MNHSTRSQYSKGFYMLLLPFLLLVNATLAQEVTANAVGGVTFVDEGDGSSPSAAAQAAVQLRGGNELLFPIKWSIGILKKATIGPLIKPTLILIAKSGVIAYVTAEIMAYLGLIGDRGEGLYDWALENESRMHRFIGKWGTRPGGFIRARLEGMLHSFRNLPPKAKFASAVSAGTTAFPLILKTSVFSGVTIVGGFIFAELLAFLGVLGDVGEGLGEWVSDGAGPLFHSFRKITAETLVVLRKKLQILTLVQSFWASLKNDKVFWAGFGIGSTASVVLPILDSLDD